MERKRKYTDEQFIDAFNSSLSIRQVLQKLKLQGAGGNYRTVHQHAERLGLDINKVQGNKTGQNIHRGHRYPITDYLSNKRAALSDRLKKRLFAEGYKEQQCEHCNQTEWQGHPIPLELDHIDENPINNNLDNLQILCANCHSIKHRPT